MSALENINKMSREEVLAKIAASGIREYGIYNEPLELRLQTAVEESKLEGKVPEVAVALNNADTDYVLLDILKDHPQEVLEGTSIAARAIGAEKKILYVPESKAELADALASVAEEYGVEIQTGIVNVRANQGNALIHIITAFELARLFEDGSHEDGVYVSVNGEAVKKVPSDTKISDLINAQDAKAILLGYHYHKPDTDGLTVAEADIANGVIRVLTEKDCIVAETEKKLLDTRRQSCGKCVFCREGLIQLAYMQKEITEGRGKMEYLDLTKEIGEAMCDSTPCSMGQTCAKIALTAIDRFADEYEAHIKKKNCPAGVCSAFVAMYIDPQSCNGCGDCVDVCPLDCIEGKSGYIHMIDEFDCSKCGKCMEVCEEGAIHKTTGKVPKLPNRLTKVGKFRKR